MKIVLTIWNHPPSPSDADLDCGGEELVVVDCLGSVADAQDSEDSEDEGWYSLSRYQLLKETNKKNIHITKPHNLCWNHNRNLKQLKSLFINGCKHAWQCCPSQGRMCGSCKMFEGMRQESTLCWPILRFSRQASSSPPPRPAVKRTREPRRQVRREHPTGDTIYNWYNLILANQTEPK